MSQSLAQRSISSVKWNAVSNAAALVVGFIQAAVLARLLPVETFGIYAAAASVVTLTGTFANFGMGGAFIHRTRETEDMDQTAANHFTLKLVFTIIWATFLLTGIFIFTDDQQTDLRTAFLVITVLDIISDFTQTPRLVLVRKVRHQRLAVMHIVNTFISAVVMILLAVNGANLWALLANNLVTAVVGIVGFYIWRPVWRPRLAWSGNTIRYFLRFGSRNFGASLLLAALDRVDDIWTGSFLGTQPLGFYSRAYRFATLPGAVLATPINAVAAGTYAELKENRQTLSLAFSRTNGLMVRSGFIVAGILALVAPEFIRIVLGAKWLPMMDAFRLMLIFTLFDPMKQTIGSLFVAVGRPGLLIRFRLLQLIVMIVGLFGMGIPLGIAGVALAVDVMLVFGILQMLWYARQFVDFSLKDLFATPFIALVAALLAGILTGEGVAVSESDWVIGFCKAAAFIIVYASILLIWDRENTSLLRKMARTHLWRKIK